jgi:hypothetical protein
MLNPILDAVADAGLLADIGTLHLDPSYDSGASEILSAPPGSTSSRSNCEEPRSPA